MRSKYQGPDIPMGPIVVTILVVVSILLSWGYIGRGAQIKAIQADLASARSESESYKTSASNAYSELERIRTMKVRVVAPSASYMYLMTGEVPVNSPDTIEFPVGTIMLGGLIPSATDGGNTIIAPIDLSVYRFGGSEEWYLWDDVDPLVQAIQHNAVIAASMRNSEGFVDY